MAKRQRYIEAPPVLCASVAPGRVHLYDVPWYWYAHGRESNPSTIRKAPQHDAERAAHRSRRLALEAAGWLWLKSRPQRYCTKTGKIIDFRQAFWTLTVPEAMNEARAREALSSWWTWARNVAGVRSYLWVAELTDRGRVHFHALVNEWMDASAVKSSWARALARQGCNVDGDNPPANIAHVEPVGSAKKVRRYVTKYVGKDFGGRAEQLATKYVQATHDADKKERRPPERVAEFRAEIRARLVDTLAKPSAVRRRWGATVDLERRPMQLAQPDAPRQYDALVRELRTMHGARWSDANEKGQAVYFDLEEATEHATPVLHAMLLAGVSSAA